MRVCAIVKANQSGIHKQLIRNDQSKKRIRRDRKGHLSFSNLDRLLIQRANVVERKCCGR